MLGLRVVGMLDITYYTASWCQPCKSFKPIAQRVAAEYGIPLTFVDVEEEGTDGEAIHGLPTLVFREGGERLLIMYGAYPEHVFREKVKEMVM